MMYSSNLSLLSPLTVRDMSNSSQSETPFLLISNFLSSGPVSFGPPSPIPDLEESAQWDVHFRRGLDVELRESRIRCIVDMDPPHSFSAPCLVDPCIGVNWNLLAIDDYLQIRVVVLGNPTSA